MLEKYFVKPQTIDQIRDSWIGEPIENYVSWLDENHYSHSSIIRRVPVLMHFGEFTRSHGANAWKELPNYVDAFVELRLKKPTKHFKDKEARRLAASTVKTPILQMFRLMIPDCSEYRREHGMALPFIDQVPAFFDYLKDERGLRETTIKSYSHCLRRFERYLKHIGLKELIALSPAVLSAFVTDSSEALGKHALKGLCEELKIFLRYLYREQMISQDLGNSLDIPLIYLSLIHYTKEYFLG